MQYERHINLREMGAIAKLTPEYRYQKKRALNIIKCAFARTDQPAYISISGGKDSIAMLALVSEVAKQLDRHIVAWVHLSDASFPGTAETCREACKQCSVELIENWSPVSAWDVIARQSSQQFGKTGFFFDAIADILRQGYGLSFIGVRSAESKRRTKAGKIHGAIFETRVPLPHIKCHPLQYFKIENVAALLSEYRLPIHPIYDKPNTESLPIRLSYATAIDLIDRGTVIFMRKNYPALYHKLLTVYPQAGDYK